MDNTTAAAASTAAPTETAAVTNADSDDYGNTYDTCDNMNASIEPLVGRSSPGDVVVQNNSSSLMMMDDSNSDASSTVMNLSEYQPKTWMSALSYGVPTVGLALLLLTHPLLCVASLGLVGMGGGMYATFDGDCGGLFGGNKDKASEADAALSKSVDDTSVPMPVVNTHTAIDNKKNSEGDGVGGGQDTDKDTRLRRTGVNTSNKNIITHPDGNAATTESSLSQQRDVPLTILSLVSSDDEPTLCLTDEDSSSSHDGNDDDTNVLSNKNNAGGGKAATGTGKPASLLAVPPKLQNKVIEASFPGLHAKEFFEVFFGDDAPFSFREFQERRGDIDITYGSWQTSLNQGNNPNQVGGNGKNGSRQKHRTIQFATPTRNPLFGPSHAPVTKIQVQRIREKRRIVMESTTTLKDVPYADRWHVKELWILESSNEENSANSANSANNNGSSDKTDDTAVVKLSVTSQAFFSKSCPFESQIRSKSLGTLRETLAAWAVVAKQALRETQRQQKQKERQQARQERQKQQEHNSNQLGNEDVEVMYNNRRRLTCVIGEDDMDDMDDFDQENEQDWELDPSSSASLSPGKTRRRQRRLRSSKVLEKITRRFSRNTPTSNRPGQATSPTSTTR